MQAVLYVAHGSRLKVAVEEARRFIRRCMEQVPIPVQEESFLELAEPSMETGFSKCVERGATCIAVMPILLLTAAHAKQDIPNTLLQLKERFPEVGVTLGSPIGVDERIADVLWDRMSEKQISPTEEDMVLVVARGSSDPGIKAELQANLEAFKNRIPGIRMDTCYLAAASPSIEEGIATANQSGSRNIFVIPYLLFTGLLMKHVQKAIPPPGQSGSEFHLCHYLGDHERMVGIIQERVMEIV